MIVGVRGRGRGVGPRCLELLGSLPDDSRTSGRSWAAKDLAGRAECGGEDEVRFSTVLEEGLCGPASNLSCRKRGPCGSQRI